MPSTKDKIMIGGLVVGGVVALGFAAWPAAIWMAVRNLEKPKYDVKKILDKRRLLVQGMYKSELREYAPYIIAEVEIPADDPKAREEGMKGALSQGFRKVANYIFGGNVPHAPDADGKEKIAMTTPVRLETTAAPAKDGDKIAMTAPVRAEPMEGGSYKVSFTMPSKYSHETLPAPKDDAVKLRTVPPMTVASIAFSGASPREEKMSQVEAELRDIMARNGVRAKVGAQPMLYQYHPPFSPGWMRLNEVLLEVE
ncbi:unnamed protein product [Pedinophyceae sp. YPF-701]|nr:unnamed protein product [Pedinophyceae sp. YPF-701]